MQYTENVRLLKIENFIEKKKKKKEDIFNVFAENVRTVAVLTCLHDLGLDKKRTTVYTCTCISHFSSTAL